MFPNVSEGPLTPVSSSSSSWKAKPLPPGREKKEPKGREGGREGLSEAYGRSKDMGGGSVGMEKGGGGAEFRWDVPPMARCWALERMK